VRAEQIEFSENANRVRVTGKIVAGGPEEFIQIGSYHTIDIEPHFAVEIKKVGGWKPYQLDRLYNAQKAMKRVKLSVVVLDEQHALFASMKEFGVSFDFTVESHASKREADYDKKKLQYFGDITKALSNVKAGKIIIAGPGFTKDNLRKFIADKHPELAQKLIYETVADAEESGVYELLKRGLAEKVMGEERMAKEFSFMEDFTTQVSKDTGLAAYGKAEIRKAIEFGAIGKLFVTDELLRKDKEIETLLDAAEKLKCEIHVFSAENPPGQQLAGLGGIAALLRFRMR
jgi:protein pelota